MTAALRVETPLPLRVVLAVALPAALALVWGRWLSPRAPRRLVRGRRVLLKVALTLAVSVALGASGLVPAAAIGGALAVVLLAVGELVGST